MIFLVTIVIFNSAQVDLNLPALFNRGSLDTSDGSVGILALVLALVASILQARVFLG